METLYLHRTSVQELECGTYWDKAIRVVTSGNNGIPEWIRHREKGSQITVELPPDWHKNNDFLGCAIYSVFIPSASGWLNCKLNFCGDGGSGSWDVDNVQFPCCQICAGSNQMCVAYYPKLAIEKHYWSNKWRLLKASFHGDDGLPVEMKECGFHLIHTQDIPEDIDTDTDTDDHRRSWDNTQGTQHNDVEPMIEYNDEQRSRDDTRSAAEDASSATAQTSYHHTPPMDTTTQNANDNVVDAQDDEDDRTHNWLELLCNFVQLICCRRY